MAMKWRRHADQAELATGSSLRLTCAVDMIKTGARSDERRSFELWKQAGPFLRRVLRAVHRPTERLIDAFDAVLEGDSLVAANKLLPGKAFGRAYVFADGDGQRSGVLKVTKLASYGLPEVAIPNAPTVKWNAEFVPAADPLVRFDLVFGDETRTWLADEVADFCDTAGVTYVDELLRQAAADQEGWGRVGLLRSDPETIDELFDEETSDDRRRELAPTPVHPPSIYSSVGRESMRQMLSVVRVFGLDGVAALAELYERLAQVDLDSLERTTVELEGRELTEDTGVHLDEEQHVDLALLAPLDLGGSTAVAIRATLVGEGPDDVPSGSTVIAPPLVITVDGERVTVDAGVDEPITAGRSDGMGAAREPVPTW